MSAVTDAAGSYRRLLGDPVLRGLAVADICARLPQGMISIALLLTAAVHASMTTAGLVVAPWLINAQGQASGIGWGIAAGLSPATIASLLAAALAVAVAAALFLSARAAHAQDPLHAARSSPALRQPSGLRH